MHRASSPYDVPDSFQELPWDIETPHGSTTETVNPPSWMSASNLCEHLAPVADARGSEGKTCASSPMPSITSSFLHRIKMTAEQMDWELKEQNAQYLKDNNLQDDKEWKYKPYIDEPIYSCGRKHKT
ncbi:uncharacterized protein EV420DRAFT_1634885 [Desarmillaria tabescens]|uniref:Uncharacterized protein n=1 Tax=Armillaria tabescens TaxID=1929756 RepID=A0AA39NRG3_ARMTA|nr:uncharacterized protein EV420DRAFT_1634885 [Desarmillaria tabescens]KAK0470461.1 hypothetical protein EV420DRAFT_1634885 [Desarmillaria tabescens]